MKSTMKSIGKNLEDEIKKKIATEKIPPPLDPETVARKGHDRTLIETRELYDSIHYEVGENGDMTTLLVGVFDPKLAEIGAVHEFGSDTVPSRPFLRSTFDEHAGEIGDELEEEAVKAITRMWTGR
jgi:phage gpG-like protein